MKTELKPDTDHAKLLTVLLQPIMTEKTTDIADKYRYYTFKVAKDANKRDIKKAVELTFDVKVEQVRVCNVKGKQKMFKQRMGRRPSWKKAYVKLKEGDDINFAGTE